MRNYFKSLPRFEIFTVGNLLFIEMFPVSSEISGLNKAGDLFDVLFTIRGKRFVNPITTGTLVVRQSFFVRAALSGAVAIF